MKHLYEEAKKNTEPDTELAKELEQNYEFVSSVESLDDGIVILIKQKGGFRQPSFAVKIRHWNYGLEELDKNRKINHVLSRSPVFVRTHGWACVNSLPEDWIGNDNNSFSLLMDKWNLEKTKLLLIFTDYFPRAQIPYEDKTLRAAIFLILHALDSARKAFKGFKHRNLTMESIKWMEVPSIFDRTVVRAGDYGAVVTPYLPKLVDFRTAKFYKDAESEPDFLWHQHLSKKNVKSATGQDHDELEYLNDTETDIDFNKTYMKQNDLFRLRYIFIQLAVDFDNDIYLEYINFFNSPEYEAAMAASVNSSKIEKLLLGSFFFRDILEKNPNPVDSKIVCSHCGINESTCCLESNPEYSYCDNEMCQESLDAGLAALLPRKIK